HLLADQSVVFAAIQASVTDGAEQQRLLRRAAELARTWPEQVASERRAILRRLLASVSVLPDRVELRLQPNKLAALLSGLPHQPQGNGADVGADPILLSVPVMLKRAGLEMRLVVVGAPGRSAPDPVLIKLIVRAQLLRNRLVQDQVGVGELAA